jgi:hypothetical protein
MPHCPAIAVLCAVLSLAVPTSARATPVSLGTAGAYTFLFADATAGSGSLNLGSSSQVTGSVGARSSLGIGASSRITGDARSAFINAGPGVIIGGIQGNLSTAQWNQLDSDARAASLAAQNLGGPGVTVASPGAVTGTTTFARQNATTVYNVPSIVLTAGNFLTLTGSPGDRFVVNVTGNADFGGLSVTNRAGVRLVGVLPDDVLFNFIGGSPFAGQVRLDKAEFYGTLLAPSRFLNLGDGNLLSGARFIGSRSVANVQVVTPPAPVPLPATGWMLLAGLATLASVARARRAG